MTLERPLADLRGVLRRAVNDAATVTRFLETVTGGPLVADVRSQCAVTLDSDGGLGTDADETVIRRVARLCGRDGTPYVDAETLFVPARLPAGARERLASGSEPIGRVLAEEGLAPVQLPAVDAMAGPRSDPVGQAPAEAVVWRRAYRLALAGRPVFAIREWFLRPVLDALSGAASATDGGPPASASP